MEEEKQRTGGAAVTCSVDLRLAQPVLAGSHLGLTWALHGPDYRKSEFQTRGYKQDSAGGSISPISGRVTSGRTAE